ncbi:MAG: type II toxin-antitoxin system HicA family toxin [Candidatus Thermoplasmatota archaeon]|nr:type II toxin-antitoxin system HicA family toxin [Candidatus Thermoplasmatota archaeon]
MKTRLPAVSGKEVIKALRKIGYEAVRQKGSHIRLRDVDNPSHKPLTIPDHKEIKPGLLRKIIRDANLSVEDFIKLL